MDVILNGTIHIVNMVIFIYIQNIIIKGIIMDIMELHDISMATMDIKNVTQEIICENHVLDIMGISITYLKNIKTNFSMNLMRFMNIIIIDQF